MFLNEQLPVVLTNIEPCLVSHDSFYVFYDYFGIPLGSLSAWQSISDSLTIAWQLLNNSSAVTYPLLNSNLIVSWYSLNYHQGKTW